MQIYRLNRISVQEVRFFAFRLKHGMELFISKIITMMNNEVMDKEYFLGLIDDKYGKNSDKAKAIRNEILTKESIVIQDLPLAQISTIEIHDGDEDADTLYLSGNILGHFNAYRRK